MLNVENLSYSYSSSDQTVEGSALISFPDFLVKEKETLLILGDSGVGKTTLLHLLGGIIKAQKGNISLNGVETSSLNGSALDAFRAENIGIIFQQAHFIRSLNVVENLVFIQKLSGLQSNRDFVFSLLEKVNLSQKHSHFTHNLSQGEKQRLNILRAIITKPKLILADEPTSALDDTNCSRVIDLLLSLVDEVNATLVLVTHDSRLKERFTNQINLV